MIDHEYLRKYAVLITIASAVTAVGAKYAVFNHQFDQFEKRQDRQEDYINQLQKEVEILKAKEEVARFQLGKLVDKLDNLMANERYIDE